jgi:hypothetical protein
MGRSWFDPTQDSRPYCRISFIGIDKYFTIDEVVFAEPGDLALLGAQTLKGLNLTVEPIERRFVVSKPLPAMAPIPDGRSQTPLIL